MSDVTEAQLRELRDLVGDANLRHGNVRETLDPGIGPGNLDAELAVRPTSTAMVADVVRFCARHRIAIVPHGGRTGLAGAASSRPGQLVLETTRLDRIVSIDADDATAVVESGVTLERVQRALEPHALSVGVDLAARGTATIGGMVSTNAGGIEAFRHGVMRHRVLGLQAVMPDGAVLDDLRRVTKVTEGYDVKQLLIGAEGTLGIITRVVLSLVPRIGPLTSTLSSCRSAAAATAVLARLSQLDGCEVGAAEIMWPRYARETASLLGDERLLGFDPNPDALFVLLDVGGDVSTLESALGDALAAGEIQGALVARNERDRQAFWRIRDESFLIDQRYPHPRWYDVSVPRARLDEYVAGLRERLDALAVDVDLFAFGHLGDGNLHLTVSSTSELPEHAETLDDLVYAELEAMGGAISAEHGIGTGKRNALARHASPTRLALMRAIKETLDPEHIMNPGKVI